MSAERPRIVIAESYTVDAVERLRAAGEVIDVAGEGESTLRDALRDADALLVRTYTAVDDALLAGAPKLRVIGRGGVGLDNIDVAAAHARGITVVYTPAASTRSVAEHAWSLILAVERRIGECQASVRAGAFLDQRKQTKFRELSELTLGVVGMGRIGSTVGRIAASGFGMRVQYHDIATVGPFDFAADAVDAETLWATSDIVTLHVPLTDRTRNLVNADRLAVVKSGAILINTARGAVVDSAALTDALHAGRLAGAGIDVFETEPLLADHPLCSAPNLVLTPHVAGRSAAALQRMNDVVVDVIAVLMGQPAQFPAPEVGW